MLLPSPFMSSLSLVLLLIQLPPTSSVIVYVADVENASSLTIWASTSLGLENLSLFISNFEHWFHNQNVFFFPFLCFCASLRSTSKSLEASFPCCKALMLLYFSASGRIINTSPLGNLECSVQGSKATENKLKASCLALR